MTETETQTIVVHTVNFGDLEVPEDKIVRFKEGLPGFPQIHRFAILEVEEIKPFEYLQSLDDPPIAFMVINPFLVAPRYTFRLSEADMEDIQSTRMEELMVYAVATIPDNPEQATLNFMAPIIVNDSNRLGKQVILHDSVYSVRHPLSEASAV